MNTRIEKNIFSASDFPGGRLAVNGLTDRSLDDPGGINQLLVKYPNEVAIDVGWMPEFDREGEYHVDVVRVDGEPGWENIIKGRCKTHEGLRELVRLFAAFAPTIPPKF